MIINLLNPSVMTRWYLLFFLFPLTFLLEGQNQLEIYKNDFIEQHSSLRAARLNIDYAKLEHQKAKKDRYPSLVLNTQYSFRQGGREYEIPTGTLLNPVYNNLTYLNTINPPPDDNRLYPKVYQEIENTSINFLRQREYDASLTAAIPIINFSVRENVNIKKLENDLAKLEYQQVFVKEWSTFKINYFSYFKRQELIALMETNKEKVERFYNKLKSRKNVDKIIENRLKQVELDEIKIGINIKEQRYLLENDKKYLLDVLGRNKTEEIKLDEVDFSKYSFSYTKEEVLEIWKKNNTNSKLINQRSAILERRLKQSRDLYKPNLDLVLSSGLQGETFSADEKPLYMIGSLRLNWSLYNPKKKIENKQIETIAQKNLIENQMLEKNMQYQIEKLFDKVQLEQDKMEFNKKNIEYQEASKFEVERKYEEGKATYFDVYNATLDVETTMLDYTKSKFDFLILTCELEKLIGVELFVQK